MIKNWRITLTLLLTYITVVGLCSAVAYSAMKKEEAPPEPQTVYVENTEYITEYVTEYVERPVFVPISKTHLVYIQENVTIEKARDWQLGDDLDSINFGKYPCRHNALYAYYFMLAKGYEPVIYEGWAKSGYNPQVKAEYHVWIEVEGCVYSDGMSLPGDYYGKAGREITFSKLVDWVRQDS